MDCSKEAWLEEPTTMVVFGASGDLAKKKTFPALFDLYVEGLLPKHVSIVGYSRSPMKDADLHKKLRPFLRKNHPGAESQVQRFCKRVSYSQGQYGSPEDLQRALALSSDRLGSPALENRVYYFALPPDVFIATAGSVRKAGVSAKGFTRLIVEKPFGHDTESAERMSADLGELFPEPNLYRIDHYLGKEMVQAFLFLRFANQWLEPLLSNQTVQSVLISFKEDIGTEGRGGYFDKSGIIRDIMQNHLMQVLAVFAMEPPQKIVGAEAPDLIRDEKVKVLKCVKPWSAKNTVLGQFEGYQDDKTVPKGSKCPTFACTVMNIENRRWSGVPFIMRAGKALNERKCEVRIQLKPPSGVEGMFGVNPPLNEIVVRVQPDEAIWINTNVKAPGLSTEVKQTFIDLTYNERYPKQKIPDAYTRLMLDVLRGQQQNFVRKDELIQAWKIVSPLLKTIDAGEIEPIGYKFGSRGPTEAKSLKENVGHWVFRH